MQDTMRNVREHHIESIWRPGKHQKKKEKEKQSMQTNKQNTQKNMKRTTGTQWRILRVREENQSEKTACETRRTKGQRETKWQSEQKAKVTRRIMMP